MTQAEEPGAAARPPAPAADGSPDEPNRPELGLEVCRLSLDLGRGRIRHAREVGIAIRCAGFVELAREGRIVGRNWPEAQAVAFPEPVDLAAPRTLSAADPIEDDPLVDHELVQDDVTADHVIPDDVIPDDDGGRMAEAVYRAVAEREGVRWRHWFNHVDADRKAATGRLVRAGVWQQDGRRLTDLTNGRTLVEQQQARMAFLQDQPPADLYSA